MYVNDAIKIKYVQTKPACASAQSDQDLDSFDSELEILQMVQANSDDPYRPAQNAV